MFSELTGQNESDTVEAKGKRLVQTACHVVDLRGLDLTGRNCGLLVVCSELGCLGGNTLKNVCVWGLDSMMKGPDHSSLTIDE